MKLTIIVPAFNEEAYLAATLNSIQTAAARLRARSEVDTDVIVVDNNSNDGTAAVARGKGATVVHEPAQGVARARNTGALHAEGDVLVFVDADVTVPPKLFDEIHSAMSDPNCVGGAVDVDYRPRRLSMRLYLRIWRVLARLTGMAQEGDAVLSTVRLRAGRRLRRGGLDRRGCRLLLEPQEVSQEEKSYGPVHPQYAGATVFPPLRQVADLEDPDMDKPSFHRIVPPTEEGLERLVLACGEVDRGRCMCSQHPG